MNSFIVPLSGGNSDLSNFFLGRKVKVDNIFQQFINNTIDSTYNIDDDFKCFLFQIEKSYTIIMSMSGIIHDDGDKFCAVLKYLETEEGFLLLHIPEGQNEVNIVLGDGIVDGVKYVFFIEHEFENDVDEIHLHARLPDQLGIWVINLK